VIQYVHYDGVPHFTCPAIFIIFHTQGLLYLEMFKHRDNFFQNPYYLEIIKKLLIFTCVASQYLILCDTATTTPTTPTPTPRFLKFYLELSRMIQKAEGSRLKAEIGSPKAEG
jgi:hypothetical protein